VSAPGGRLRLRELPIEAVRIYLGIAMFFKGIEVIEHGADLMKGPGLSKLPFDLVALTHAVAAVHLVGGMLLALGMLTRAAAIAQLPVVAGAIFFAHRYEGLFAPSHGLELAMLVLFLLGAVALQGGGPLSVDRWLDRTSRPIDDAIDDAVQLPPMKPANEQRGPARKAGKAGKRA